MVLRMSVRVDLEGLIYSDGSLYTTGTESRGLYHVTQICVHCSSDDLSSCLDFVGELHSPSIGWFPGSEVLLRSIVTSPLA